MLKIYSVNFVLDQFVLDQQSSSNTGLVAGSVTLSVINLTLIVLLIVQSMGMIYMKKYVITIQTCNWAGLIIVNITDILNKK